MHMRSSVSLALMLFALLMAGCTTANGLIDEVYKVGESGPSGGLVFFDKGEFSDGWRYLEVAPASTETLASWGYEGLVLETGTAIGSGFSNTQALVAQQSNFGGTAALYCNTLEVKNITGWYLPSKDELDLLFSNLARTGKDTFRQEGFAYWSSSLVDAQRSWAQGFSNAVQGRVEKSELLVVRAIRSF